MTLIHPRKMMTVIKA